VYNNNLMVFFRRWREALRFTAYKYNYSYSEVGDELCCVRHAIWNDSWLQKSISCKAALTSDITQS